ncbi:DUF5333 domain-containing protein [Paracoccus sp. (in: a-proteobacteria)]|uniref:DUF5333 domain-containing protein n=1 Tax=Paracoccus sp. TaxID=267 RepID=UPI0035B034E2
MKPLQTLAATAIALTLTGTALAQPAAALEPLSQEKYVNDRLIAARIADRIRKTCPTINARIFYAYGEARKLQGYARKKGYSDAQIDAFLDDKTEKKRIYAVAEDYLTRKGAAKSDPESFCRIGRDEIAKNTIIGSLLVAK